jgi:putative transposase
VFKSELIHPNGPWRDRDHLEAAVLDWVHWFNTERTHESIDDLTPAQPSSRTTSTEPASPRPADT